MQKKPRSLDYLNDPNFQGVNRLFILILVEQVYNVVSDGRNFFNETVKNNLRAYDTIQKIATGQE